MNTDDMSIIVAARQRFEAFDAEDWAMRGQRIVWLSVHLEDIEDICIDKWRRFIKPVPGAEQWDVRECLLQIRKVLPPNRYRTGPRNRAAHSVRAILKWVPQ